MLANGNPLGPPPTSTEPRLKQLGIKSGAKVVADEGMGAFGFRPVMRRWADPAELGYPVLWLASDEAPYVTAATLMVEDGLPA